MRTGRPSSPPFAERGLLPGRVVRVDRGLCDVVTSVGTVRADTEFVVPRDPMKVVCTGDWVAVDPEGSNPHYVRTLLPRRTAFVRSTSSKRSEGQVLATNIDHVVICVSLAAELDLGRIERFLALAMSCSSGEALLHNAADSWESGATCATVKSAYAVSPARSRSVAAPPALHGQSAA